MQPTEKQTPLSEAASSEPAAPRGPVEFGVLSSPGYRNRKGALERTRRVLAQHPQVPHLEVANPSDVAAALRQFEAEHIDVVCVNGGDGTLSMVLTELLRRKKDEELPLIVALRGGRTNMSHVDVGLRGDPAKGLKRLIAWAASGGEGGEIIERPVLSLRRVPDEDKHYGLFVGAAAIYKASQSLWDKRDRSRLPGIGTVLGTVVEVGTVATSLILGRRPFEATRIRALVDGQELSCQDFVMLFVTTLERMALGSRPFWGEDLGGPLRLSSIAHEHRHFLRATLAGLRGRQSRHLVPERGYEGRSGRTVELHLDEPVTLDGEVFRPVTGLPLLIESSRRARFLKV
ncbi:MAG: hypothetical protein H6807_00905 [Planctomycetes bacterium]|nr:hypothetical protein [Planctomycetota bacterium]